MSDKPADIMMFVELRTDRPLTERAVRTWYSIVKKNVPSGVLGAVQVMRPGHELQSVMMVHREQGDRHHYIIPLNRHLLIAETQKCVEQWDDIYSNDYDIEASSVITPACVKATEPDEIELEHDSYDEFCEQLAKHQHSRWLQERTDNGWRFGEKMSLKERTHPMLRPWEELPEQYRKVDYDIPNRLLEFLNEQGYIVVHRTDYEKLVKPKKS